MNYQSKKTNRTSKIPPEVKLLRKLAISLSDAKAIRGISPGAPAIRSLADTLKTQIKQCGAFPLDPTTLGDLLATGEADMLQVADADDIRISLQDDQWRRYLKTTKPDIVRKLIERQKLSCKGIAPHLFAQMAKGSSQWADVLGFVEAHSSQPDKLTISKRHRGLLAHPSVNLAAAGYLRNEVERFPSHYRELAKNFIAQGKAYRVLVLHQAGIGFDEMEASPPDPKQPVRRMFREINSSGHARISFHSIAPNLAITLKNHASVANWLHEKLRDYS